MISEEKELLSEILFEIKELQCKFNEIKPLIPDELSLSEVSYITRKSCNTLRKYLIANFEPDVDYRKKGGRIYVRQGVILRIRSHYER